MTKYLPFFFCFLILACQTQQAPPKEPPTPQIVGNPPMEGFDLEHSDAQAIEIADQVMEAMGGRQAWEDSRHFRWTFGGGRVHYWDKLTGNSRIIYPDGKKEVLFNVHTKEGQVTLNGEAQTHPDSLSKHIQAAYRHWINDSYWLVMPFKLKDSGVTLTYAGQDSTQAGTLADVLQLTFEGVGVTPQNKYLVYVDPDQHLVTEWAYYPNATDEAPRFNMPWLDYQTYGSILLAGDHGRLKLTDIAVLDELPESVYTSFESIE